MSVVGAWLVDAVDDSGVGSHEDVSKSKTCRVKYIYIYIYIYKKHAKHIK